MTDKLQYVVEKFIAESETEAECGAGSFFKCIDVDDIRAFLAQYVLCEKEPVAWQIFDGEGNNDLYRDGNEWCAQNRQRYEGTIYHDWYTPLHAPAKEPK